MEFLLAYRWFNLGTLGVGVFFVLSGFILTYNYASVFQGGVRAEAYGRFIWDRLSKVYPLYFFTTLLCIPIQLAGNHRAWSWPAFALHLTLTQSDYPGQRLKLTDQFNIPGWSISCELLFYVLAPVLIWVCLRARRWGQILLPALVLWPLGLAILAKWSENLLWPARFAPLRVPEFCLGVATAVCFIRFQPSLKRNQVCLWVGLLLLGVSVLLDNVVPRALAAGPLSAPGAALLIYGLANGQGWLARALSHRWVVLLGASSFAFYLIHDPVIRVCKGICQHYQITVPGFWAAMALGVALFVLIQALSICTFKLVEMPLQRRLRALVRKKPSPHPTPAP